MIKILLHAEPYLELPPFLQPIPYSHFLYFSGALEVEVFYRLIPIVLVLLFFLLIKRESYQSRAFWIVVNISSFRKPLEQLAQGAY